jgi:MFS transporter, DHA2 family, multidrug resistance protein
MSGEAQSPLPGTQSQVPLVPPAPPAPEAPRAPPAPPGLPPAPTQIPWLGLLAVLMGTFISTLNGRLSTFGAADIRGAVHAGFDEGAWITTVQSAAQILVAPAAVWMGTAFGPRRVLFIAAVAFGVISILTPFSPNLPTLLTLQFSAGLASGFFVPLTLSFVLLNTPPKYWAYGIAVYALNLELSLNISASLEGWYVDHQSWRWIYWQNAPLAAVMALCLHYGVRPRPAAAAPAPKRDLFGLVSGGLGLALIYAALDQGNRLDWLNSGQIWALMLAGIVLLGGFIIHEARSANPLVNFKVALAGPLPSLLLLIALLRLTILSSGYLIPLFLGAVRGFRALEVGQTLIWIAVPQLLFCPLAGLMLRRSDPRLVASIGFVFICIASLTVAYGLTPIWGSDQFLPSQLLQAVGQSFALSGVVFFSVLHLRPQDAVTFGGAIQVARQLGGEVGTAFVITFARVRGQVASNLIGLHVQVGDGQVLQRLHTYAAVTARAGDPESGMLRGASVLGSVVRAAATTQAVMDTFVAVSALTAVALIVASAQKAAPLGPASARPLFAPRDPTP